MTIATDPVLEIRDLSVQIETTRGVALALDQVSLSIAAGETLAVVGESGSGKTMTALSILGLQPQVARIVGGEVLLNGRNLVGLSPTEWGSIRGSQIAMIMQDPLTALNPVFRVSRQVGEGPRVHQGLKGKLLQRRVVELLEMVKIPRAAQRSRDYPHQFSGGMRQRVVGAIGIACHPTLLIADEPTTSLDVTVERAYLELLKELQRETGVGILFVTHDFGIVESFADRVAVMYSGRVIETGPADQIIGQPAHPYTEGLVRSVPNLREPPPARLPSIPGSPPELFSDKPACHFAPRCSYVMDKCLSIEPPPFQVRDDQIATCWRYE